MSALALALLARGYEVRGSDRSHDKGQTPEKFEKLAEAGVKLYPQDGSGIDGAVSVLVVSSAIEETIPDVRAARNNSVAIQKRAEVLAELFNRSRGIAVGGTSGKSTVTAMMGHIFESAGLDATMINGAVMMDAAGVNRKGLGNAMIGQGDIMVIEADESDGSIAYYEPAISVLTNVTLDHKPVEEIRPLFADFLIKAKEGCVVNRDDPESAVILQSNSPANVTGFSLKDPQADFFADDISYSAHGAAKFRITEKFTGLSEVCTLKVPGRHNVENALAALAASRMAGVSLQNCVGALADFGGVKRRLEYVGEEKGVAVIDDFAHNPDKIRASLEALSQTAGRKIVIFQPHGFGPMKMMRQEITQSFADGMDTSDILIMPDIFYAGGTASKDISSADLIADVKGKGRQAVYLATRPEIRTYLKAQAQSGDRIIVMGARDDTLPGFCQDILMDMKAV